jgi:DNA-binding MarR family transcriptional regulator
MSSQAMGELVDELESLGYVVRRPDPRDRRAKLNVLARKGKACVEAGRSTMKDLEDEITRRLGQRDIIRSGECSRSCSTPSRLPRRPSSSTTWC